MTRWYSSAVERARCLPQGDRGAKREVAGRIRGIGRRGMRVAALAQVSMPIYRSGEFPGCQGFPVATDAGCFRGWPALPRPFRPPTHWRLNIFPVCATAACSLCEFATAAEQPCCIKGNHKAKMLLRLSSRRICGRAHFSGSSERGLDRLIGSKALLTATLTGQSPVRQRSLTPLLRRARRIEASCPLRM